MMGCRRMAADNEALPLGDTARLPSPYYPGRANETTKHREIMRIYHQATPETRRIYDLGHDTQAYSIENWIIRWVLWHVCRYISTQIQYRRTASKAEIRPDRDQNSSSKLVLAGKIIWLR
nr:hypothetical protein CFP56_37259 [Quercus suber]